MRFPAYFLVKGATNQSRFREVDVGSNFDWRRVKESVVIFNLLQGAMRSRALDVGVGRMPILRRSLYDI